MRNKQILVRLDHAEYQQLAELCQQLQLNQSEVIRHQLFNQKPSAQVDLAQIQELRIIALQLKQILQRDDCLTAAERANHTTDLEALIEALKLIVRKLSRGVHRT
ncbi:ABC transporter substrate-binding protein [Serratia sp. S1B]|nr:ABC transporter substrate-binding protein [Serratia sp. S1B]